MKIMIIVGTSTDKLMNSTQIVNLYDKITVIPIVRVMTPVCKISNLLMFLELYSLSEVWI